MNVMIDNSGKARSVGKERECFYVKSEDFETKGESFM